MKSKLLEHFAPQLLLLVIVLILILNSVLVTGIQIAMEYPHLSPEDPFKAEADWELLAQFSTGHVNCYIIWQNDSQWRLVITEQHFHAMRWRTVCDTILMEQNFSGEFPVKTGRVIVKLNGYADIEQFNWLSTPVYGTLRIPGDYLLWNAGLMIVEITGWLLIRKLRGKEFIFIRKNRAYNNP